MHDVLVVGAGLSAAAACAVLKQKYRVLVLETRNHLGGNCYDYKVQGTHIQRYGAHIYHNPNAELHKWVSQFTSWIELPTKRHYVEAEVFWKEGLKRCPFPYSQETIEALGEDLSDEAIIDTFFRGYSEKQWGMPWENLPMTIRNRLPKRLGGPSDFFPGQIQALPQFGYSYMMENMFDGCEVILGNDPNDWPHFIPASGRVIYCGRLDLIRTPGGSVLGNDRIEYELQSGETPSYGQRTVVNDGPEGIKVGYERMDLNVQGAWLKHVNVEYQWGTAALPVPGTPAVLNYCHKFRPETRRVQHALLTGGTSEIYHTETPRHHGGSDIIAPTYPAPPTHMTRKILAHLNVRAKELYPGLIPLGRVAQHQYMDMHQAIGAGKAVGERFVAMA
jgi:UDP-galactopyranose mutase